MTDVCSVVCVVCLAPGIKFPEVSVICVDGSQHLDWSVFESV